MRTLLLTVPLILATAVPCPEAGAGSPPELPAPLAEALRSSEAGIVARIDWQALRSHPVVAAVEDLRRDDSPVGDSPAASVIARLVAVPGVGELDLELVSEVWMVGRGVGPTIWLRAAGDGEAFEDELRRSGWSRGQGEPPSWVAPLRPHERQWIDDIEDDVEDPADREEILAHLEANRRRLSVFGRGWFVAHHGWDQPEGASGTEAASFVEPDDLPFPAQALLDAGRTALVAFAIDFTDDAPGENAGSPGPPTRDDRRAELRRQLDALQTTESTMFARLGDVAGSVSETDGGLVLDVETRRTDGGGVEETERFLQMLVLAVRFGVAPTAPALDREVGDTVIVPGPDGVRLTARVSDATLLDTLRADAERRREARRLWRELQELEEIEEITEPLEQAPAASHSAGVP